MGKRNKHVTWAAVLSVVMGWATTGFGAVIVTTNLADDGDLQFNTTGSAVSTTGVSASNALRVKITPPAAGGTVEEGSTATTDRISFIRFDTTSLDSNFALATVSLTTLTAASNQFISGQNLYLYGMNDGNANGQNFSNTTTASTFLYGTGLNSATDPRPASDTIADRVNDALLSPLATIPIAVTATGSTTYTFQSDALTAYVQAQKTAGSTAAFIVASDALPAANGTNTPAFFSADNTTTGHISPTLTETQAVPEPGSLAVVAFGTGGLLIRRRRKA